MTTPSTELPLAVHFQKGLDLLALKESGEERLEYSEAELAAALIPILRRYVSNESDDQPLDMAERITQAIKAELAITTRLVREAVDANPSNAAFAKLDFVTGQASGLRRAAIIARSFAQDGGASNG